MQIFISTFSQMLVIFLFLAIGFILRKKNIVSDNAPSILSKMELYVFNVALTLKNMINYCTVENFKANLDLVFYGFATILFAIAISYPLSRLFVKNSKENSERKYLRNIYKYALTFGNYGFMGNFIVLSIFGDEMFFKYSMFTLSINILCTSWGLGILMPSDAKKSRIKQLVKCFLTPPFISMIVGILLGFADIKQYIPPFLNTVLSNAADCMGPVAMLLAGMAVGGYNFKGLFTNKKIYLVTLFRLILIPVTLLLILKLIKVSETILICSLIAYATPLGMNTIVYPAAFGGETKTGSSMAMISNIFAIITIPLMYLLFVVVL